MFELIRPKLKIEHDPEYLCSNPYCYICHDGKADISWNQLVNIIFDGYIKKVRIVGGRDMLKSITRLFKKKPVVKPLEKLDKHSEAGYRLDVAILTIIGICEDYSEPGMKAMAKEISRQVGEKILQRGLRQWIL